MRLGVGLTAAFVVLRTGNVYGDPVQWALHASSVLTAVSFLNVTKYPPSLLFLLMTLGPALLLLRALESEAPRILRPALVFGRVPMFYFVLHLSLVHLLAVIVGGPVRDRALDVRIAEPRRVPVHPTTGLGTVAADNLRPLGVGCGGAVSDLPVVCCREAAPRPLVAELSLKVRWARQ